MSESEIKQIKLKIVFGSYPLVLPLLIFVFWAGVIVILIVTGMIYSINKRRKEHYGLIQPEYDPDVLEYIVTEFRKYLKTHYSDSMVGMDTKTIASIYDLSKLPRILYKEPVVRKMCYELSYAEAIFTDNGFGRKRYARKLGIVIIVATIIFVYLSFTWQPLIDFMYYLASIVFPMEP